MFTGLVECVGETVSIAGSLGGMAEIAIKAPIIASEISPGESVAVAGACLTAIRSDGETFTAQMMAETLRATRLGSLKPGDALNLERALKTGGRLDGHMVLGHVDEVGEVLDVETAGDSKIIRISASEKISWATAPKGSVAIDGVSLTVMDSWRGGFSIGLIPATLARATLGSVRRGDGVNVEIDVIARYAARLFGKDAESPAGSGLTWEKLAEYGWKQKNGRTWI
ncbi:MAG: riboflavin synthase [Synergistaceae bacterium]|jgi:riboflavin synthase|nr:riboflavin synthase [Synergistaceae bacterium]